MRSYLSILKNDYCRTIPRLITIIIITLLTLVSIVMAVYITSTQQIKSHVVFVTDKNISLSSFKNSKYLDVTITNKKPPLSDLIRQRYDAYISVNKNGVYKVDTLYSDSYKNTILAILNNQKIKANYLNQSERSIGVNIIGFMMMFIMMLTFSNMFVFADDKEQGQLKRVSASPISFKSYILAHYTYCLSMLVPEFILIVIIKVLGWNIGFSLLEYLVLMLTIGLASTSFAFLLNTLIHKPDNANMLGNSIIVLTSVLSGSFYSLAKNNTVFDNVIKVLPQKQLMNFAQAIQDNNVASNIGSLLYILIISFIMFIISNIILKSIYVKHA